MAREALPEDARDKPIEVWFADEARVGQQGTLTRLWARTGTQPRAPRDCRYAWAYLLGAFRPERGVGAGLVMPYADIQAISAHLAEISAAVAPGAQAILVLDDAGWHSSAALVVLDNITLLPLPPHGPEINPVEDVWQYLRQAWLSLKIWEDPPAAISLPRIGDVVRYQGILRPVDRCRHTLVHRACPLFSPRA